MAGYLASCRTATTAIQLFLRPVTVGLEGQRSAGGNATASAPHGNIRTEADLPEVTLPTVLYRLIFKRYYNRIHELQVQ